jgi:hypothetical protein
VLAGFGEPLRVYLAPRLLLLWREIEDAAAILFDRCDGHFWKPSLHEDPETQPFAL